MFLCGVICISNKSRVSTMYSIWLPNPMKEVIEGTVRDRVFKSQADFIKTAIREKIERMHE